MSRDAAIGLEFKQEIDFAEILDRLVRAGWESGPARAERRPTAPHGRGQGVSQGARCRDLNRRRGQQRPHRRRGEGLHPHLRRQRLPHHDQGQVSTAKIGLWNISCTNLNQIEQILEKIDQDGTWTVKHTAGYRYNEYRRWRSRLGP
ncbi:hypothetical protein ACTMTI_24175 [Nonomuraea sp. H19]|uniref:hypothetical protein n=1 Tax=Nonomuraea sp. H19 TaxID=3452206 RepID=UPI003F889250